MTARLRCYDRNVTIPVFVTRLFWDTDPAAIDLARHSDYVIERVMLRGGWDAMRWLREAYPTDVLADFLRRRGARRLPPRELAYWALMTGVEVSVPEGGGRPAWAGA